MKYYNISYLLENIKDNSKIHLSCFGWISYVFWYVCDNFIENFTFFWGISCVNFLLNFIIGWIWQADDFILNFFLILQPIFFNPSYLKFPTYLTVPSQKTSICFINQLRFILWEMKFIVKFLALLNVDCWVLNFLINTTTDITELKT